MDSTLEEAFLEEKQVGPRARGPVVLEDKFVVVVHTGPWRHQHTGTAMKYNQICCKCFGKVMSVYVLVTSA